MIKILFAIAILIIPVHGRAQTATPEIPDPNFNDIAAVFPSNSSPTGAVIIYNPNRCNAMGLACQFFKVHEHAHVYLNHLMKNLPPVIRERDADREAAGNASPNAVFVAWQLFMNGGSSANWHTYGTPYQRAHRLCIFAQQAQNWIGPSPCP